MLVQWLHNGWLVDAIIGLTLLEAIVLLAYRHGTGRGLGAEALLPNLAAGVCLMLALRAALQGAAWHWIALALAGAGLAHLLDLRARWRQSR